MVTIWIVGRIHKDVLMEVTLTVARYATNDLGYNALFIEREMYGVVFEEAG